MRLTCRRYYRLPFLSLQYSLQTYRIIMILECKIMRNNQVASRWAIPRIQRREETLRTVYLRELWREDSNLIFLLQSTVCALYDGAN